MADADNQAILAAFIGQFYSDKDPAQFCLSLRSQREALLRAALSEAAGKQIQIAHPQRGGRRKLLDMAVRNAEEALARKLSESASQRRLLEAVADVFGMDEAPQRVEIYDNSHIQGRHAIGAMVCAGPEGFIKSAYRKFNMKESGKYAVTDGDFCNDAPDDPSPV